MESNPSVSITLKLAIWLSHTPVVQRVRWRAASRTGKSEAKRALRRVLLPDPWVPRMEMVRLAVG